MVQFTPTGGCFTFLGYIHGLKKGLGTSLKMARKIKNPKVRKEATWKALYELLSVHR